MIDPVERAILYALYNVSIAFGIMLMPIALLARRMGVTLPIHRVIDRVDRAYTER